MLLSMMLRISTPVVLFLARPRFSLLKPIPKIIKDCYGESVLKLVLSLKEKIYVAEKRN